MTNTKLLNTLNRVSIFISAGIGYSLIDQVVNLKKVNEEAVAQANQNAELMSTLSELKTQIKSLETKVNLVNEKIYFLDKKVDLVDNKGDLLNPNVEIANTTLEKLVDQGKNIINNLSGSILESAKSFGNRPNSSVARVSKDSVVDTV